MKIRRILFGLIGVILTITLIAVIMNWRMVVFLLGFNHSAENLKVIPNDAMSVVFVDARSLVGNVGFSGLLDLLDHESFDVAREKKDEFDNKFDEEFETNPFELGINFDCKVAGWVLQQKGDILMAMSIALNDSDDWEDFLMDVARYQNVDLDIDHDGQTKWVVLSNDWLDKASRSEMNPTVLAWDEDKLLLVVATSRRADLQGVQLAARNMMSLSTKDQFIDDPDFASFVSQERDFGLWVDGAQIIQMVPSYAFMDIPEEVREQVLGFARGQFANHLNFDVGAVTLSGSRTELPNSVEEILNKPFERKLLAYLPADLPGVISLAMNVDGLEDMAQSTMEEGQKELLYGILNRELGIDRVSDVFGGSVLMGFHGIQDNELDVQGQKVKAGKRPSRTEPIPIISLVVELESEAFFLSDQWNNLVSAVAEEKDGHYAVEGPGGIMVYMDWDRETLLLTNHLKTASNFDQGGYGKMGLSSMSKEALDIGTSNFYMKGDWNHLLRQSDSNALELIMGEFMSAMRLPDGSAMTDVFDKITLKGNNHSWTTQFHTVDSERNSMIVMLELILDQMEKK